MNKLFVSAFLLVSFSSFSQSALTLFEVVEIAKSNSIYAKRAETTKENRYWQYKTYQAGLLPQLSLNGNVPTFTKAYRGILQNDGTILYQNLNRNVAELNLSLTQVISKTGGAISLSSSLDRVDDFNKNTLVFGGDPISLGFNQPLFGFNSYKWEKRIEPLRYEESKREFVEEFEQISSIASSLFFDLLTAQISLQIANQNVMSNDTIYKIAQGRYRLGKIPENELLQLELSLMNSRQSVAQAELNLEITQLRLKSYLGFAKGENLQLVLPAELPEFDVNEDMALSMAKNNRSDAIAFKRRVFEAEREVNRAVGTSGLNANLAGSLGLTNQGSYVSQVYENPGNQLVAEIRFGIPIVDWGLQKAIKRTAEANLRLVEYTVQADSLTFEEEVFTQVRTFKMLRNQVAISQKADEISQKRYDISKNRYLIGKISITDLSLALTEKDRAKQDYLMSLGNFWAAYYRLRALTLYDFATEKLLYVP
ncbi:MAG: TolC family protein [Cyclobacteriaceae bacterium]|nr:TolC family protein [Cyclobacteriaceae bacterium]